MTEALRLEVILGSVRPQRVGAAVADWVLDQARHDRRFDAHLLDLAEFDLPSSLELNDSARAFGDRIQAADAIIAVTPEYNHSTSGALKDAFDILKQQWRAKPVGFVSYGGLSGGLRAVEHLRQVVAELHMVSTRETVSFHLVRRAITDGVLQPEPAAVDAIGRLLTQLDWWGRHLRSARSADPYPA